MILQINMLHIKFISRPGTKQQSIHHYKTLQSLDFTEIRAFFIPYTSL